MAENWVCNCKVHAGGKHIVNAKHRACAACGAEQNDARDILVPTGEGGTLCVSILDIESDGCLVKNEGNGPFDDQMPPYIVAFADIRAIPA